MAKASARLGRQPVAVIMGSGELKIHSGQLALGRFVFNLDIRDWNPSVNNREATLIGDFLLALVTGRFGQ